MDVWLASSSPRRTQLLTQIGVDHRVVKPEIDELQFEHLDPIVMVRTLCVCKAKAVCERVSTGLVIAADTTVVYDNAIFSKPRSMEHAIDMLSCLSGKRHKVITGVAVMDATDGRYRLGHSMAHVWFLKMTTAEKEAYVATAEPMDKAGSYSIQGYFARFVERIDGDFYAVVGLPLAMTSRFLADLGYQF